MCKVLATSGKQRKWSKWRNKVGERRQSKQRSRDVPGGPLVKTPCIQCRGPGFNPWSGNQIPYAATKTQCRQKKKKEPSLTILVDTLQPFTSKIKSFVRSWNHQIVELPHAVEQLRQRATTTEPVLQSPGATTTKPTHPRAHVSQQEKPPQQETCSPQLESSPCFPQLEKAYLQQPRPSTAENK